MTRLRKDQAEELLVALESATSGPLEEITLARARLTVALRVVLDRPDDDWDTLLDLAATTDAWLPGRAEILKQATAPDRSDDPETLLWALWELVTELTERRTLGP